MESVMKYAKPLLTVIVALVVIHYVAPAALKKHTGTG